MENFENSDFTGERAEYFAENLKYENCNFKDGESHLKHAKNISAENSTFQWKYPLWNAENVKVTDSEIHEGGRAGIWYTNNISIKNTKIEAPKQFRRCDKVFLDNVTIPNAAETFWSCNNVELKDVKACGDYFAMNTNNIKAENLELNGNYPFDGSKNVEIRNSRLISKDSFWNCENITVYDSYISGEYLGWNSKNLKFVNCTIESEQGLCYIDGLVLKNCTLNNTNLAFEYSSKIDAEIVNKIDSVKNPISGKIKAKEIETLILNDKRINPKKTKIVAEKIYNQYKDDPNPNENLYQGKK